ncbi:MULTISPECIES: hypothetical protein [Pseudoalteromonas]|uniref:Uncharacterized protein n=1 Tax=Pseudoalteromonas carrageenovora IAM 12662 TaxID=1314868 RepID=A0A2K4X7V3_PSEVC|nr:MULTISPECIES: hypothetical protein [Pseudoalteromonas]KTF17716.1 hypothetical protein ATS74_03165 [Pseudoalteromonas sp. H103]MBE0382617.1 hypothetical protein [Pseudoalteromonas carrageenovora IAM 12662]MCQ8889991.1 hypothetical protein [Pseudoalteromonas carrageenovora]MDO6464170.1 hypothetical protein [Pseudoalteromonas carrageenovora]MDO6549113.1 hypothetical protein [Pseudoalteromonas carrageenovora]
MKQGLGIRLIICSSFLSLLIACSDTNNTREWLLKNDNLYYKNTAVDWRVESVDGCKTCVITQDVAYQPEGMSSYNTLIQNQNWVAVHELSKTNVIRLKMPYQTPYLYVERVKGKTLTLFDQQQNHSIKIGEVTSVNFNNQHFNILIKSFEEVDKQSVALPRRATLEFIALKID